MHIQVGIINCPVCVRRIDCKTSFPSLVICSNCVCSYQRKGNTVDFLQQERAVLEDMTPLRLETRGQYENKTFEIIGRIQYNFEKNYRNLWALLFADGMYAWLSEAYGDYVILGKKNLPLNAPVIANLKAGRTVELTGGKSYDVDRVDRNISIQMEGELPEYTRDNTGFMCVELSMGGEEKALIHMLAHYKTVVYTGSIRPFESFKFTHLRELRDWI